MLSEDESNGASPFDFFRLTVEQSQYTCLDVDMVVNAVPECF